MVFNFLVSNKFFTLLGFKNCLNFLLDMTTTLDNRLDTNLSFRADMSEKEAWKKHYENWRTRSKLVDSVVRGDTTFTTQLEAYIDGQYTYSIKELKEVVKELPPSTAFKVIFNPLSLGVLIPSIFYGLDRLLARMFNGNDLDKIEAYDSSLADFNLTRRQYMNISFAFLATIFASVGTLGLQLDLNVSARAKDNAEFYDAKRDLAYKP